MHFGAGIAARLPQFYVYMAVATLLALATLAHAGTLAPSTAGPAEAYALNLQSTRVSPLPLHLPEFDVFKGHRIYVVRNEVGGKIWHRVRLGFFPTRVAAAEALEQIKAAFPGAWIVKAGREEQEYARTWDGAFAAAPTPPPQPAPLLVAAAATTSGEGSMVPVMNDARQAMLEKNYSRAVALYTKVLQSSDDSQKQEAQELLGLARERNHQLAHAVAEYQIYLQRYPKGEGAERVKQRLAALLSAGESPKQTLQAARGRPAEFVQTDVFGSFSQYYRRDVSSTQATGSNVDQEYLISDLDIVARRRSNDYDLRALFNGGYRHQFVQSGTGADAQIRYLYVDATDRKRNVSGRLGRQSLSTGGVLGRFDGGLFTYPLTQRWRVSAVAGYPVNLSSLNAVHTTTHFAGLSLDAGTFAQYWDFELYGIQQQNNGLLDRRAVGGELRYSRLERSLFALLDYDTSYKVLNTGMMLANWRFPNNSTLGLTLDYRRTPTLMTGNAIIGQAVTSLVDLKNRFTEQELRGLALDRTPLYRALTLSGSRPLTAKLQLSADATISVLSGTPASGGVEATPSTGREGYYDVQLISTDLFTANDITIFGLRYSDASTMHTTSLLANTRVPLGQNWRFNPRLRLDWQKRVAAGSHVLLVSPSVLLNYRWKRKVTFEFETGYQYSNDSVIVNSNDRRSYYLSVGYRWDFQ